MRHLFLMLRPASLVCGIIVCQGLLSGCGPRLPLAGALVLDTLALEVEFATTVEHPGGERALGSRFARSAERLKAEHIHVVLLDNTGGEHPMVPEVDRTGEASVCLRDVAPGPAVNTGARLQAAVRIEVERLFWRSPTHAGFRK